MPEEDAEASEEEGGTAEEATTAAESFVVTSEDGGTTMTFNADGTCVFAFETYGIAEECTWTYEGGKLTVTNPSGDAAEAEGDPMTLHYVSAASPDLVGDYVVAAADLSFG